MIRNYLRLAFRNLRRHRSFAFINIAGLAIGIASTIVLFMVVRYELSFDRSYPGYEQVYHVYTEHQSAERTNLSGGVPYPALQALRTEFPQALIGSLFSNSPGQVTVLGKDANAASDRKYMEDKGLFFAEPEWFSVFGHEWLSGSAASLAEPNNVVLTRTMADKYFGDWKLAMGQYIRLDNLLNLKVTGVIQDPPSNTDYPVGVIASFITHKNNPGAYGYNEEWGANTSNYQVFMKLPAGVSASSVQPTLNSYNKKYYPARADGRNRRNLLQPLSEVHYERLTDTFGDHTISKSTIWTLSLVGVFILVMACINFINLSTAQAVNRSKEIGIRKVLGSRRSGLFLQMMGETALMVFAALLAGILIAFLALPYIHHITPISEGLSLFTLPVIGFAILLLIVVTLLAGSYPALIMSGFKPLLALKNKITSASVAGVSLRRGLVVAQFAISQVLIIGTIVAVAQMHHVQKADIGFNQHGVLVLNFANDSVVHSRSAAFKESVKGIPGVSWVSYSSDVPSSENNWTNNFAFDHKEDEAFNVYLKYADADFFNAYGIKFESGRGFAKSDTVREVVINHTLMDKLGLRNPQDAIGKDIQLGGRPWNKIVGVVRDFQTNSLRENTKPMYLASDLTNYSVLSVRLTSNNLAATTREVEALWNRYYPEYVFRSAYMDENIAAFYQQENQLSLLYQVFAGIAILISCLGLYGLVSFMAVQRKKEVGIRKTLGASSSHIVYLFSREFTILVLIAFAIAAPLSWYLMNSWLNNFAYRIPISAWIFAVAIFSSLLVAWVTVGYKSLKAAFANPVRSLRSE